MVEQLEGPHTRSGRGFFRNDSSIWSLETSLIVIAFYRWNPDNKLPSFYMTGSVRKQFLFVNVRRSRPLLKHTVST